MMDRHRGVEGDDGGHEKWLVTRSYDVDDSTRNCAV